MGVEEITGGWPVFFAIILDPGQFIMEQKFLRELKIRGELPSEEFVEEAPRVSKL